VAIVVVISMSIAASTAAGSSGGNRFTSNRYGYSALPPAGWTVHRSASPHPADSPYFPTVDDPSADRFNSPGRDFGVIAVTATRVGSGLTLRAWSGGTPKRLQLALGCKPRGPSTGRVGSDAAAIFTIPPTCGGTGYAGIDYAVAHHGYGYDIQLASLPSYEAQDRAVLVRFLRTFRFVR
jgi:hypothetical protein